MIWKRLILLALSLLAVGVLFASPASDTRRNDAARMRAYRKMHPDCAWCLRAPAFRANEVHHVTPCATGHGSSDLITLCRECHVVLAHMRNTRLYYVVNIRELVESRKIGRMP